MMHTTTADAPANANAGAAPRFNVLSALDSSGMATARTCVSGETIYAQGDACDHVFYVRFGNRQALSGCSKDGREAVVGVPGSCGFFGDACLKGLKVRTGNAAAVGPAVILQIGTADMAQLLRQDHELSRWFISHVILRIARVEEDLLDQLLNRV